MTRNTSIVLLVVFLCSCSNKTSNDAVDAGLSFIHLNDTYRIGAVESGNAGGLGRVATVVKATQAAGRDVRILHGGDFLYPSLESQLWNGAQMIEALNFLDDIAPLYAVIGNHELDRRTPEHLVNAVRGSRFDWLGDNYSFDTGEGDVDAALKSGHIFEQGGRKVGIFSLTMHPDHGGNQRDYAPIHGDYLDVARSAIKAFEAQGVDLVIGLTHLHFWQDKAVAKLKAEHPNFLFIGGGHEHEPEFSEATRTSAAVYKGASNARVIWRIDVAFDAEGNPYIEQKTPIEMLAAVEPDPGFDVLAGSWRARLVEKFPFLEARVGEAAVPLDAREVTIRNVESNWGNFIVDQMRTAFGDEAADFAFINSGTLRIDDFISGDITFEDIGRTFGFSSFLRHVRLTGAEFKQVLEAGYRGAGTSQGYFPQVSGFRVCVDRTRQDYDRIISLQAPTADGWQEIDANASYAVVVSDFVFRGGDGYVFPPDAPASMSGSELKYLVLDAVMVAQAQGLKVGAVIDPDNPRIVELGAQREACFAP
jgi:5'-nucleotidase